MIRIKMDWNDPIDGQDMLDKLLAEEDADAEALAHAKDVPEWVTRQHQWNNG